MATDSAFPAVKLGFAALLVVLIILAVGPVPYRVSAQALVEGSVQRSAVAPFEGYLREAPARAGDTVKAGQVLAVLDDKDLKLERVRWESGVVLRAWGARCRRAAQARAERMHAPCAIPCDAIATSIISWPSPPTHMSKDFVTPAVVFAALGLVATAGVAQAADAGYTCLNEPFQRIELRSPVEAGDNRGLAAIEEQRLTEMLEQRRLHSPFNGVVTERLRHVGEMATTGENARPVLRLAQTHPLRVEVVVPVSLYGQLKPGQRATVETEPPLSARYRAAVTIVDRVVEPASGTFGVRLELPNPNGTIPAGEKCRVTFT